MLNLKNPSTQKMRAIEKDMAPLDDYTQFLKDSSRAIGRTVFSNGDDTFSMPWEQPEGSGTQYTTKRQTGGPLTYDGDSYYLGGDTVNPANKSKFLKRDSPVPSVLGIETTDKTSRGIFESSSGVVKQGSILDRLTQYQSSSLKPTTVDMNALNNPALMNLETVRVNQNPLSANFFDEPATLTGADSAGIVTGAGPSEPIPPSESPSLLGTFGLRESAWKETGVFIVGAIILAIGIFALTR